MFERVEASEIDKDQRTMSQESGVQWLTSNVSWRIASTDELDSLQANPLPVSCSPETMLFGQLSEEGDDCHCAIFVRIRQIDLIAEDYQPLAWLFRSKSDAIDCLVVLAIMLELLHDEAWVGRRREIDEDHLELRQCFKRRHESHGLS